MAAGEIPEETAGPYPGDGSNGANVLTESGIVRSDVTASFGTALSGAAVYLWHCNRDGGYSLYSESIAEENYLRGVQDTGCWTSQVVQEQAAHLPARPPAGACEDVYATDGYEASVANLAAVSLDSDLVFADGCSPPAGHRHRIGRRRRRHLAERPGLSPTGGWLDGGVPSALPSGEPAPEDGSLPESALAGLGQRPFGIYVHVPFCTVRCGYCDFNTYTAEELGPAGGAPGASRATYAEAAIAEVRRARAALGDVDVPVDTVFFGGGTPTLLGAADLGAIVASIASEFGLADDAEVTTEANPDSVALWDLEELRRVGFDRVSFGMQSAVDHVLRTLDRTHDPLRVPAVVEWARSAGFEPAAGGSISLDLIYGTPGESLEDWALSVEVALACAPDHVSAYSLIVEEGTALARRVKRGELPMPDEDDLADKYLLVDERLSAAGLDWYEVSNWARGPESRCRHNLLYWTGGDWWGVGPGAHSHVGGVRWWNVKHPAAYADRIASGRSPAQAREVLDDETRRVERVLLELRLRDGLPVDVLDAAGRSAVPGLVGRGLLTDDGPRLVPTRRGRLLADAVVRDLLP